MKLLVCNRGEIAIRALNAARELGLQTVAVYADEQDKSHCDAAHESIKLKSSASFLDPEQIIAAAKSVQATAIHPGYGFLSESTELAEQCRQAAIVFVGPSPSCIAAVGDKVSARQVAQAACVPIIPGTDRSVTCVDEVLAFGDRHGYPLMLKARDGGGGRGIRMVHTGDEVTDALQRCRNESPTRQVFVEKAITGAKHIEVQILGDKHGNLIHLLERDCSAQRRYQKVIEVAPCPSLEADLRQALHAAAVRLGRHIQYDSAGTVEFLVQPQHNQFYFLEVNPRIQVEHTITEQITQVDLVQSQIRIALGQRLDVDLRLTQASIPLVPRQVAIQARIVAENPSKGNILSVGKISGVQFPQGQGIRVDTWIKPGCVVLPTFDSLLAKVIVSGQGYEDAVQKLLLALERTDILGVDTNMDFMAALISSAMFTNDRMLGVHINALEEQTQSVLQATESFAQARLARRQQASIHNSSAETLSSSTSAIGTMAFKPGDAFNIELGDTLDQAGAYQAHTVQIDTISTNNFPDEFVAKIQTTLQPTSRPLNVSITRKSAIGSTLRRKASARQPAEAASPVTGMIVEISVNEGDVVEVGQELFVMSAMKMETVVRATVPGRVQAIYAKPNDLVEAGDLIVETAENKESKL